MTLQSSRITRKIISLNIDLIGYGDALSKILAWGKNRDSRYICFANVHMAIEAYQDDDFAAQVNKASLVLADGIPVVKTLKSFYGAKQERIAGMDLFPDLIRQAEINQLKVFFFGTTPEVLEAIRKKTEKDFPRLTIAGLFSPPFEKSLDDESYVQRINDSGAELVFVALGCPKQEKWMANHSHKINAPLLGVGGAFPVYANITSRAPQLMRNIGLEWLYRLFQEPQRLFKRYLKTNTLFMYLTIKMKIKQVLN